MDALGLARLQFAFTAGFHFLFPPISIGLAWLLVISEWFGWRRQDAVYEAVGKFFGRLFAITFAVGVATGIVMEFQFGTNWSAYSKFVGDIFGAPLAAEGVFAFFLESTFLGIYLWGRGRVSRGLHWFSSLMVAFGATLSALWIIIANSWQQTPAGLRRPERPRRAHRLLGRRLQPLHAPALLPHRGRGPGRGGLRHGRRGRLAPAPRPALRLRPQGHPARGRLGPGRLVPRGHAVRPPARPAGGADPAGEVRRHRGALHEPDGRAAGPVRAPRSRKPPDAQGAIEIPGLLSGWPSAMPAPTCRGSTSSRWRTGRRSGSPS